MPFILGEDRNQINLLPLTLDDFVSEDNPVRVIDAYVDSLNLEECYQERIKQLNAIKEELKEQGKKTSCLIDSDAKSMKNNGKFEVCFNFQAVVDNKNKLFVDYEVVNDVNDQGQLSNMVKKAKEVFENQNITALADTGYFNMSEIVDVANEQTEILIKPQKGKQQKVENGL